MKLFNWMQRRFHHTALKDGVAKNEEMNITNGSGKQSLLKQQVALADVLGGYGILTIGTLGLDPLKPFNQYFVLEQDEESDIDYSDEQQELETYLVDNDYEEEEEESPLIFTRIEDNYGEMGSNCEISSVARKEKGERTTLAELFMADSDRKKKHEFAEFIENNKVSKKPPKNNGLSFAKKLIPHFKDDSRRPIKKIHRMVKRMLKRKIHPEIEESRGSDISDSVVSMLTVSTGPAV